MEHTFMSIHDLTPDCNILFVSESVDTILGWRAEDVRGRSVFNYFHPDEVPYARSIHSRGVLLDKAASLHYVRILSAYGQWISCECCFTVVHDVLVACTSIYRYDGTSERRKLEGAQVRRIFSSSPRDPRYHMLEHLSPKFQLPPVEREPRAALVLNRFSRNLPIMYATNAVMSVLGLTPDQVKDKSFYRFIQERCLAEAVRCLEGAKANDSIAYLRFWSRDPRDDAELEAQDDEDGDVDEDGDAEMGGRDVASSTSDSDDGGAALDGQMDVDRENSRPAVIKQEDDDDDAVRLPSLARDGSVGEGPSSAARAGGNVAAPSPGPDGWPRPARRNGRQPLPSVEVEAVVSCTMDGLVVIIRRARPAIPLPAAAQLPHQQQQQQQQWNYDNGLFAAPWAQQPVQPQYFNNNNIINNYNFNDNQRAPAQAAVAGPPLDHLMRSIRDVAVFAWALVGINGNLAEYSHGRPRDMAAPPDGLPIWDPRSGSSSSSGGAAATQSQQPPPAYEPPENQAVARWVAYDQHLAKEKENGRARQAAALGQAAAAGGGSYYGLGGSSNGGSASGNGNHYTFQQQGSGGGTPMYAAPPPSAYQPQGGFGYVPAERRQPKPTVERPEDVERKGQRR